MESEQSLALSLYLNNVPEKTEKEELIISVFLFCPFYIFMFFIYSEPKISLTTDPFRYEVLK